MANMKLIVACYIMVKIILLLGIATSPVSGAMVDQLTPAVYVMNKGSSSIGPAIRITESTPVPSAISNISIVLATTPAALTQVGRCLFEKCQDQRLSEANLLPHAIDMLALAQLVHTREGTAGQNNCSMVIFDYNSTDPSLSSYGEIERGQLPYDFGTGEFSFSFVATLTKQVFIFLVPDSTNRSLPVSEVKTDFGLRIQRKFVQFSHKYIRDSIAVKKEQTIGLQNTNIKELFDGTPKHYTLVITANPPQLTVYLDCEKLKTVSLKGDPIRPNPNSNVFIKRSQPHTNSIDKAGGEFHGLYYHPMALNKSQVTHFCGCGFEGLLPPPLNLTDGVTVEIASNRHSVHLLGKSGPISNQVATTVLRAISYTNQLEFSTVDSSTRQLHFNITSEDGVSGLSMGTIVLVNSDNTLPNIDLNGVQKQGNDISITKRSPFAVSPQAVVTRDIEGFPSISPTISSVLVQLTNAVDNGNEQLTATTTSQVLSVRATNNNQTLEIVGPGLPSEFNSVLQAILYVNLKENPTTSTQRMISFLVTDTEGRRKTQQAISTINLLASTSNPPQLSLAKDVNISMGVVTFTEGSTGVYVAPKITIKHGNNFLLKAEVTLSSPFLSFDKLSMKTVPTLTFTLNQSTYTICGAGSFSDYRAVLSTIKFSSTRNPSLDSNSHSRVVAIRVFDGLNSNALSIEIKHSHNQHPPTLFLPDKVVATHDNMVITIAPSANITHNSQFLQNMTIELTGLGNNTLSVGNQTGRMLVFYEGSIPEFVSILRSVAFKGKDLDSPQTIHIQVCDSISCAIGVITVEVEELKTHNFETTTAIVLIIVLVIVPVVIISPVVLLLATSFRSNKKGNITPPEKCNVENTYDSMPLPEAESSEI